MTVLWYTGLWLAMALPAPVQGTRGLVERALDEPTEITLERVTLRDAIQKITEQTGARIEMAPEVMAMVPHGAETLLERVAIAHIPLRQGLTELFAPLGMTLIVRDGFVEVIPKPALLCLGRPPTWEELDTLAELSAMQPGLNADALSSLQSRIQFQMVVPDAWARLAEAIRQVGAGPGDEVLTIACDRLGWAWCLSENRMVISSIADLIRRQLQQPINLRMNNRPLIEVLQALGERVHVAVRAEPGALQSLPLPLQRNFSLNVSDTPAELVLDRIAAYTGLSYLMEPEGVLFYRVSDREERRVDNAETASPADDPYVGKVVVSLGDGTSMEWLIRRSELPPDLQARRQADLQKAFDALRQPIEGRD